MRFRGTPSSIATFLHDRDGDDELHDVDIAHNRLKSSGFAVIAPALAQMQLRELNLNMNVLGDDGVLEVAKLLMRTPIEKLDLRMNRITYLGARYLAYATRFNKTLRVLDVGNNSIGPAGGAVLAAALPHNSLVSLNLYGNDLYRTHEAVDALAEFLPHSGLTYLDVSHNGIPKSVADKLARLMPGGVLSAFAMLPGLYDRKLPEYNVYLDDAEEAHSRSKRIHVHA
jgi:Ran GTPase-activating protein (RanGAP) involved in mRNA processing and transport